MRALQTNVSADSSHCSLQKFPFSSTCFPTSICVPANVVKSWSDEKLSTNSSSISSRSRNQKINSPHEGAKIPRLIICVRIRFLCSWGIFFAIPLVLSPCLLDSVAHLDIFCWGLLCIMAANALIAIIALNRAIALSDISIFIPLGLCKYAILYFFDYVIFHKVPSTWHTLGIVSGIMCIVLLRQALQRQHQKEDYTDFNTARLYQKV